MKVNKKLLKRLYLIDHTSEHEGDMKSFILNYCYNIPKVKYQLDDYGNLFITKNTTNPDYYVCLLAHMDGVNSFKHARELYMTGDIIRARYIGSHIQCGLNADDSNGILVALQLLETFPDLKICFTVEEELGALGADEATNNVDFFADVKCFFQADRRGNDDLIVHTNGITIASNKLVEDIDDIRSAYGYEQATGTFTDVGTLVEAFEIAGFNISCGYYSEHTSFEYCSLHDLEKCLNFIHDLVERVSKNDTVYTITIPKPSYKIYGGKNFYSKYGYGYGSSQSSYVDDSPKDNYIPCDYCDDMDCMHCQYTDKF